jgi:hypothetical protein
MSAEKDIRFCNNCDYAESAYALHHLRFDISCPRCGKENLVGNVYKLNSDTHRQRRRLWELGEVDGSPLPYHAE